MSHTFHIPVLGLGYSIDTPVKVARYGISSAISIVDDELIERMRKYYTLKRKEHFLPINKFEDDYRARRITAYLNLLDELVTEQFEALKALPFSGDNELSRYFDLLPERSQLKQGYELMMDEPDSERRKIFEALLRQKMTIGSIDVNIMAKLDKLNFTRDEMPLSNEFTDALSALRGFAQSSLRSSVILSAGMNPRLYSYIESFPDFLPDASGELKKKIILKVSDYRSALIQAKFLAKKGLWVSEFRVESGLNCGGHAFATEGYLLGPILEEFKEKRAEMYASLLETYQASLAGKGIVNNARPAQRLSAQGGIGTAGENQFILDNYQLDSTGWGSPFLLVPEATNVDENTLTSLAGARESDFYLSDASPLGILFNNFKQSSIEKLRALRLEKNRPGSPCTKKYLVSNTEFTEEPICTASREYQSLKIKQLQASGITEDEYRERYTSITEKICLCEGLCSSAYIKLDIVKPRENTAVAICPGPNIAYFDRTYTLEEMVGHIYGFTDLLGGAKRPHMFIKELNLYIEYLQAEVKKQLKQLNDKKEKSLIAFKKQVEEGINYYKALINKLPDQTAAFLQTWHDELSGSEDKLKQIQI